MDTESWELEGRNHNIFQLGDVNIKKRLIEKLPTTRSVNLLFDHNF